MRSQLIELNNGPNIQKEKEIVTEMIHLYCRKKHKSNNLCKDCYALKGYALTRLSVCRFGEGKSACSNCPIHCYKLKYREKMKIVMRYAGPWMLVYHPVFSVKHLLNKPKNIKKVIN
jgi:superfamily II helicase